MNRFSLRRGLFGALIVSGAGCTAILGIETDYKLGASGGSTGTTGTGTTSSSTGTGTSSSTGTGAPPIDGTLKVTHVTSTVQNPTPVNFQSGHTIKAFDASFNEYPGVGLADGTFTIQGVPSGRYLLDVDGEYHSLTSRVIDLSRAVIGKDNVPADTITGTTYGFDVTGMVPWQAGDGIQLFSAAAGVISYNTLTSFTTNKPAPGDTTLTASDGWVFTIEPDNLIQNDTTSLAQLVNGTSGGGKPYQYIGAFQNLPAFTIVTGSTTNAIPGTLHNVNPNQTQTVKWTATAFTGLASEVNASATLASNTYYLDPLPGGSLATGPFAPEEPAVVAMSSNVDVNGETVSYANPYPAGWTLIERAIAQFNVPVALSGHAATPLIASVTTALPANTAMTLTPLVGAAHLPSVDSVAFATGGKMSIQPTVSWSAPTTGANQPDHYVVFVHFLAVAANNATKIGFTASFNTDQTSLKLPPGIITAGTSYVFVIRSRYTGGVTYETAPNQDGFPHAEADTVSGVFAAQ